MLWAIEADLPIAISDFGMRISDFVFSELPLSYGVARLSGYVTYPSKIRPRTRNPKSELRIPKSEIGGSAAIQNVSIHLRSIAPTPGYRVDLSPLELVQYPSTR